MCIYVLVFVHECRYSEIPKEGTEYPGAGIIGGYELRKSVVGTKLEFSARVVYALTC